MHPDSSSWSTKARPYVKELTVEAARKPHRKEPQHCPDGMWREDNEWQRNHAAEAIHLGKGILERDLEKTVPDHTAKSSCYCGGGYRSVLTAAVAQK